MLVGFFGFWRAEEAESGPPTLIIFCYPHRTLTTMRFSFSLLFSLSGLAVAEARKGKGGKKKGFDLRILHVNDHHSHLESEGFDIGTNTGFPVSLQKYAEVEVAVGGWPLLTTAMAAAAEQGEYLGYEVLKLHAGDAVTGTLYYTLFEGEADAAFMNSICFDAFALGNHEFDDGDQGLSDFLDFLNGAPEEAEDTSRSSKGGKGGKGGKGKYGKEYKDSCYTPVVAANVVPGPDSPLQGRLMRNVVFDYNDHKVGVVGIDIRQKTLVSSNPDDGTDLLDEETVAREQVAILQEQGVDVIILLTHIGLGNDLSTIATIPGVDIVVGGDSHTFMGFTPPVPIEETTLDYPGTFRQSIAFGVKRTQILTRINVSSLQQKLSPRRMAPSLASCRHSSIPIFSEFWMRLLTSTGTSCRAAAIRLCRTRWIPTKS